MKKHILLVSLLAALLFAKEAMAQSTNIIVTVVTPPTAPLVHQIKIPATVVTGFTATLLPQIDPQAAGVTGKVAQSIQLHANADGSWSGTIIFR